MKQKTFFITFKGLSLQQIKQVLLKGESRVRIGGVHVRIRG